MKQLQGAVAVLTGASGGIGSALARRLAGLGASLVLCGRSEEKLAQVREACREAGAQVLTVTGDCTENDFPRRLMETVCESFGRLDILINCAGMALSCPLEETLPEQFDRIMALNVRAPYLICQAALPLLRKSERATILNIASVVGHKGYPLQSAYAASKHALIGFSKSLANEVYEEGIRVHVISPGAVFTDMVRVSRPDLSEEGMILVSDVADAAEFLLTHRTNAVIDELQLHRAGKAPFA